MNTPLITLVEQAVQEQMRRKASFTGLDISNRLKADRYPVQHREVAEIVRDIYDSGAMASYSYTRKMIDVMTAGGTKPAKAYLYHFEEVRPRTYATRAQDALPMVPPDQARALSETEASTPRFQYSGRDKARCDGAVSIPRRLLRQLGWPDGQALSLSQDEDRWIIQPAPTGRPGDRLHIWSGLRLRICQTKLSRSGLSASRVRVERQADCLVITEAER